MAEARARSLFDLNLGFESTPPGEGSLPEAGMREVVRLLSPAIQNLAQSQSPILVHLDIGEGVCVQVVGDGMADPPLLVAQAGEVKVEPGSKGHESGLEPT